MALAPQQLERCVEKHAEARKRIAAPARLSTSIASHRNAPLRNRVTERVQETPLTVTETGSVRPPDYDLRFALDVSQSMAGAKMTDSKEFIRELVTSLLKNNDGIGIRTFSTDIKVTVPRWKSEDYTSQSLSRYTFAAITSHRIM